MKTKMKQLLFIALATSTLLGCQQSMDSVQPTEDTAGSERVEADIRLTGLWRLSKIDPGYVVVPQKTPTPIPNEIYRFSGTSFSVIKNNKIAEVGVFTTGKSKNSKDVIVFHSGLPFQPASSGLKTTSSYYTIKVVITDTKPVMELTLSSRQTGNILQPNTPVVSDDGPVYHYVKIQ